MSRVVALTQEAANGLKGQIDFLLEHNANAAAVALKDRVATFLSNTLARFPSIGRRIPDRDIWEIWIPKTRLVIWYRFSDDALTVLAVWHTAQNREQD